MTALLLRIGAATVGTYALAMLWTIAFAVAWPGGRADAVLLGTVTSFALGTGAIVWCFAAATAVRAWIGLALAAVPLGLLALWGGAA